MKPHMVKGSDSETHNTGTADWELHMASLNHIFWTLFGGVVGAVVVSVVSVLLVKSWVYRTHRDPIKEKWSVRTRQVATGAEGHMSERTTYETLEERFFERDAEADEIAANYLRRHYIGIAVFPGLTAFALLIWMLW
jgi:hypothetical protein